MHIPQRHIMQPQYHPHSMGNINIANDTVAIKHIRDYSYSMSDKLGLGMTAHVYKGKNDTTNKRVAVKVIDLSSIDKLSYGLINEEIATLQKIKTSQLKCHNLLRLQQVLKTQNHLYIITEFCEGKDMGKILRQKKNLSELQAQSVMKQLINGYRQLNQMGIIHRDLKISNIFVTQGKIKLADFGFAIQQQKCGTIMTYNVGTPHYMAPQVLRFNKYSIKGDIWSLGVIAYELVYGKPPYKDKIDAKLYELMTTIPIQNLFDPNIKVSNQYKNFIYQCLQVDPNIRATPQQVFNYSWPLSQSFVEGFQEQVKIPEVIKVPGMNYAVYRNSNKQISYQSKQLDIDDFKIDHNQQTQSVIVSQLSYCIFLIDLYDILKNLAKNNSSFGPLINQLAITIQSKIKNITKQVRSNKNIYETNDLDTYLQTADWQNLKQVIIRNKLSGQQPLSKFTQIPYTPTLPSLISKLKYQLPQNWRLLDKLMSYFQIREISRKLDDLNFSYAVDFDRLIKDIRLPDEAFNPQTKIPALSQRIQKAGL